ncbi:hypothetical protein O53_808 [Microcystis aeruginosa TAIHU98]|uniref:PIN domain-containing protein n=1 Tax=Microcystis aeruginosa TAIHU98 TaxID=1134457 RepID=L7EBF6_MICAE|nr:hypothetical protein [Microcystis aeruginosa]ELP56206.1 hypothetical protein O53_808 [Microcystis aeruginosa TAIHU98]
MGAICLIDTSIFLEILNVPHKASQSELILQKLEEKIKARESLFLPMATILETGNHIAQNRDGNQRRICAEKFVNQVTQALEGKSSFTPISFLRKEDLQGWLKEFPDQAMGGRGLGDLSIIHDWQKICDQNPSRRVYIWSLDKHLKGYERPPKL